MFIKDRCLVVIILFVVLCSCGPIDYKEVYLQYKIDDANNKQLKDSVLKMADDTISDWINDSIIDVKYITNNTWAVDSIIVFSSDKTKAIGSLLISKTETRPQYVQDDITNLLCEKINGQWYFFLGATMVLPPIARTCCP